MVTLIRKQQNNHLNEAKKKSRGSDTKKQLRIAITLAILFGLGWIFGLGGTQALPEAVSVPFQILFSTLVGFQGLFIFLLYVIFSSNARKEWKRWILHKQDHSHKSLFETSFPYQSPRTQSIGSSVVSNPYLSGRGIIYKNAFSSKLLSSCISTSIHDDCRATGMSTHQSAISEMESTLDTVEYELSESCTNYPNPLDGETLSLKSETDDTESLIETTFTLPVLFSQEDTQSVYEEESDLSKTTTFINPILSMSQKKPVDRQSDNNLPDTVLPLS